MCKYRDSTVLNLRFVLQHPDFEALNKRTFTQLILTACGSYGVEARRLAIELLNQYLNWFLNFRGQPCDPMFTRGELIYMIDYVTHLDERMLSDDSENNQLVALEWMTFLMEQFNLF